MLRILKTLLLVGGCLFISTIVHAERNAFWQNLGPEGGWGGLIAVAPSDPDVLYATVLFPVGANHHALFRSGDGGDSWEETTSLGPDHVINTLVVDPVNSAKVYVAYFSLTEPVSGILISSDGGTHWQQAKIEDFGISNGSIPIVTAMMLDPNHPDVAYMADTGTGGNGRPPAIYQTTDGGANWFRVNRTPLNSADVSALSLLIDPDSGILYATWSANEIPPSRSTDNGRTWEALAGLPVDSNVNAMALDPGVTNALYAIALIGTYPAEPLKVLYHSTDGGFSWSVVNPDLPLFSAQQLIVHPMMSQLLYASDGGDTYRSDDGGVSWRSLESDGWLAIDDNDAEKLYLAAQRGLLRSNDRGSTLELANHGIPYSIIEQIVLDPNTAGVVYTITNSGLFKSADAGQSWRLLDNGLPPDINELVINPADSRLLYADRFRSSDGGESWSEMDLAIATVIDITLIASVPDTLYAVGFKEREGSFDSAILRSSDAGEHWHDTLANGLPAARMITDLEADPVNPARLYARVRDCFSFFCTYDLYKSDDSGDHWRNLGVKGHQLRIDPQNPQRLYLLEANTVQISTDGGETWQRIELEPPLSAASLALDSNNQQTLYLSTGNIILRSRDGGHSWSAINNTDLPGDASPIEFDPHGNTLYAGSFASGLYQVLPDYPVVWWDQTRSGQGLSLWPRGERIWGVWFVYGENGEPVWLVFEGKPVNGLITAPLLRFQGPVLGASWDTSQVIDTPVGQINLDLSTPQAPLMSASINGIEPSFDFSLSAFRPQANGSLSGVWLDPQQSGQGIVLSQQGHELWGVFHRYDESGDDIWVIFQGQFQGNMFTAELLRFSGPTLGAAWNESLVLDSSVGQVTIKQQATDQLIFNYTLNGHSSVLNLQPF